MNKRKALFVLGVLLLSGVVIGYELYSRKTADVVHMRPDFIGTAADLTHLFEQDADAAHKRFHEQIIQLTGRIKSVNSAGAVVLEGSNGWEVVVGLDERNRADANKMQPGSLVTLQGIYSGFEQGNKATDDLLAGLAAAVQLRAAGLKE